MVEDSIKEIKEQLESEFDLHFDTLMELEIKQIIEK